MPFVPFAWGAFGSTCCVEASELDESWPVALETPVGSLGVVVLPE